MYFYVVIASSISHPQEQHAIRFPGVVSYFVGRRRFTNLNVIARKNWQDVSPFVYCLTWFNMV
jgi:hypothetical protein